LQFNRFRKPESAHGDRQLKTSNSQYSGATSITLNAVSEIVQVPSDLATFAADPQFHQTLLKIKEQSDIICINVNRKHGDPSIAESITIESRNNPKAAMLARQLLETHFMQQLKYQAAQSKLQNVQTNLFMAQGEIASGMSIEFTIPKCLIGVAVGKKGVRINKVKEATNVIAINFDDTVDELLSELMHILCLLFSYFFKYCRQGCYTWTGFVISANGKGTC